MNRRSTKSRSVVKLIGYYISVNLVTLVSSSSAQLVEIIVNLELHRLSVQFLYKTFRKASLVGASCEINSNNYKLSS